MVLTTVLTALWLMLPAFLANMAPVLVGGGKPIDGGRDWKDGRRVLGNGKTWRGILLGPLLATALVGILQLVANRTAWGETFPSWGPGLWWIAIAYAMALGALVGDAVESFFKRRTGRDRGQRWFPFDQLDFVVGGLLFGFLMASVLFLAGAVSPHWFLAVFTWPRLLVVLLLTPALHVMVNLVGFKLGLKQVPW